MCQLYYSKFPKDVNQRTVLLCDPMLATGSSAIMAVKELLAARVPQNKIIIVNIISSQVGCQVSHEQPMHAHLPSTTGYWWMLVWVSAFIFGRRYWKLIHKSGW